MPTVMQSSTLRCSTCEQLVPFAKYDEHKKECNVSVIVCPVPDCNFKGNIETLAAHVIHHDIHHNTHVLSVPSKMEMPICVALTDPTRLIVCTQDPPRIASVSFVPASGSHAPFLSPQALKSICEISAQSMPASTITVTMVDHNQHEIESHKAPMNNRSAVIARCIARSESNAIEPTSMVSTSVPLSTFMQRHVLGYHPTDISPTVFHRRHEHTRVMYMFSFMVE